MSEVEAWLVGLAQLPQNVSMYFFWKYSL